MTKRIFRSICFAALTVFLASMLLILWALYSYFSGVSQEQLRMQTNLAAQGVANEGADFFDNLSVRDYRITWIDKDGVVLYDSELNTAQMENHLKREEVIEAFEKGFGESRRYSDTLLQQSLYCAQCLPDGTVLRLSISQDSIVTLLWGMAWWVCIIFVIAVLLSVVLAVRLARKIVKPLNDINLDAPLSNEEYDELSPLLLRIDVQQKELKLQEETLRQKQDELETIINSMNEGMLLLNGEGKVVSINPAACNLLGAGTDCIGVDMLTLNRNLDLQELLSKALSGRRGERIVELGRSWQVNANPIIYENRIKGAAMFFFDVTERQEAEQLRREFSANVSHELKTPLHSISGYAELLKNHMVKSEDVIPFCEKIYDEAQRMMRLVEDIISLSRLDEGAEGMERGSVDLYELAQRVVKSLEPEAEAASVSVNLSGEPAVLTGFLQPLHSIIYNLCDNAVKYNKRGGSVDVHVKKENGNVVLCVRDTGIGIDVKEQERIFERFYRVDKSRFKEAGGTGLGLSIVKHAVKIHDGKIETDSAVGKGTTITVTLPE